MLNNFLLQIFKYSIKILLPVLVPTKPRLLAGGREHQAAKSGLISTLERRKAEKSGLPEEGWRCSRNKWMWRSELLFS